MDQVAQYRLVDARRRSHSLVAPAVAGDQAAAPQLRRTTIRSDTRLAHGCVAGDQVGWLVAWAGGLGATIVIGAAAGLLTALRAARMSPTQALWTLCRGALRWVNDPPASLL
jgi:hypothetical protein